MTSCDTPFGQWFARLQDLYEQMFRESLSLDREAARDYYNDGYEVTEYFEMLKDWA